MWWLMSYVARASRLVPVSVDVAFDTLVDHNSWPRWMPASFRSVGKGQGKLTVGAQRKVKVLGSPFPSPIRVEVVDRAREVTWGGGIPGLVKGRHRFLFEPKGDSSVEVSSVETWSGALAALLRPVLQPLAERVGREQLDALEREALGRSAVPTASS